MAASDDAKTMACRTDDDSFGSLRDHDRGGHAVQQEREQVFRRDDRDDCRRERDQERLAEQQADKA